MNNIYIYILFFLCGIFIYYIINNIDKLDIGDDPPIIIYNNYVYTFHPDPIVRVEQIANRNWSSSLNFYPNYCNLDNGYGDDFYCDDFIGLTAGYVPCGTRIDIENSYIYLTRLKLPDNIKNKSPNNLYVPLDDCGCTEFKDENGDTSIYGTESSKLLNGNTWLYCYSDNKINIKNNININTGFFCCGKEWTINNIKTDDITTIFIPDGQFFTLQLVQDITYNCSCNIQTLEDANKLLKVTEDSLEKYLFSDTPTNTKVENIKNYPNNELIDICNNINIKDTKYDVNSDDFLTNKDYYGYCEETENRNDCTEYYDKTKKCPNDCNQNFTNSIECKCSNCLLYTTNCSSIQNGIECSRSYNNANNKCFWGNCYDVITKLIDKNNNRTELLDTFKCAEFMGKNQEILKKYGCNNTQISKYCVDLKSQERLSKYPYSTDINDIKKCLENDESIDKEYNC